jgi:hypothetical protein
VQLWKLSIAAVVAIARDFLYFSFMIIYFFFSFLNFALIAELIAKDKKNRRKMSRDLEKRNCCT